MAKVGRPSEYTQVKADSICAELALGRSLKTVCKDENMPAIATVFKWMRENKEFLNQYARAKEESADAMSEEILDISDDGTNDWMQDQYMKGKSPGWKVNGEAVQRSKLRVDTRKWIMSKMKPKKYGDKTDITSGGEPIIVSIVNYKDEGTSTS